MKTRPFWGLIFSFFNVVVICSAFGQDLRTQKCSEGSRCNLGDFAKVHALTSGDIFKALEEPETLNKVLDMVIVSDSKWRLLKDLNLRFKTFKANDGGSEALGLNYKFSKDIDKRLFVENIANQIGRSFSVNFEGNVSFDRTIDPNDFLDSNFSIHFFHSHGGAVAVNDEIKTKLNKLEDKLAEIDKRGALSQSSVFKEFSDIMLTRITNQFYIDFSLIGGLESNQSFTEKQYYCGGQLGLEAKAWNPSSTLARYNIFDWPFAAIRWLSQSDEKFRPRGSTIPTVLIGADLVEPQSGVVKQVHSDDQTFTRFRLEAAFRTPIARIPNSDFAYFEANYRYYQEFTASSEVKQANFDNFQYLGSELILPNGLFVGYSTGRLPLDAKSDQVYELGFKFNF